jgi:endonuclease YncB( thermonuclease family)
MKTFLILYNILVFAIYQEYNYTGKITRVIDGDTFNMQTATGIIKVRLDGIDCPENKQPFSADSKAFLNRYLNMQCKLTAKGKDRYGRILAVLWVDGTNINLLMVHKGYAWHFKKYSKDTALAEAEIKARESRKGLWQEPNPIAPWDWRKR